MKIKWLHDYQKISSLSKTLAREYADREQLLYREMLAASTSAGNSDVDNVNLVERGSLEGRPPRVI